MAKDHLGIVHTTCSPREMIRMCGSWTGDLCEATLGAHPEIVIDGEVDATFACVEYCLHTIFLNIWQTHTRPCRVCSHRDTQERLPGDHRAAC